MNKHWSPPMWEWKEFSTQFDPQMSALYFNLDVICWFAAHSQEGKLLIYKEFGIINSGAMGWKNTTDINVWNELQWPAGVTNLSEMHEPFIKLIKETADKGKSAAMYGCRGWTLHHNTDIGVQQGLSMVQHTEYGQPAVLGFCQHLWDRYLFSGDSDYPQKHIP